MKRTTTFSRGLPMLVCLSVGVAFALVTLSRRDGAITSDRGGGGEEAAGFLSDESAVRAGPVRREAKAPVSLDQEAYAVRRLSPLVWERMSREHGLSVRARRVFIRRPLPVEVNLAVLEAVREMAESRIRLDLGLEEPVIAEVGYRFEHGEKAFSLGGKIEGHPHSEFSISVYEDAVVGTFRSDEFGVRQLRFVGNGVHRVEEVIEELAPGCQVDRGEGDVARVEPGPPGPGPVDAIRPEHRALRKAASAADGEESKPGKAEPKNDPGDGQDAASAVELDVLVAYTPGAVSSEGSLNALLALINQGVADTNIAFQSSGINAVLQLVGTTQVSYSGTNGSSALNALRSTTDGVMDSVHSVRDSTGADFVSLWTPLSDVCGIASLITTLNVSQAYRAFGVTDPDCQFKYTFSHELGHNWGCMHAVGDAGGARGEGIYNYSHGWRWDGANGVEYRTIMAYSPGSVIRQFSDPGVFFQGAATGRANLEDNARTISQTMGVMSQFRTRSPGGDDHGDSPATATSIPTNSSITAVLHSPTDLDVFRFQLTFSSTITMETVGSTDTRGRLMNASGATMVSDSNSGSSSNFSITRTLGAGTYYIEVGGESGATGPYALVISGTGGDDHGNDRSSATPVPVPGSMAGSLETGGDEDFFRLNVSVPGTLEVSTTGATDTFGYLQDSSGATLVSDDDDGAGTNFSFTYFVTPGIYYVRLRGYSSATTGGYHLIVGFTEIIDDHANGFAEATTVTTGSIAAPAVVDGEFEIAGDVDMMRFTLFGVASDPADQLAITFDSGGPAPGTAVEIVSRDEGGYRVSSRPGSDMWHVGADYHIDGVFFADNGTPNIKFIPGDTFELSRVDGTAFTAVAIDLAEWSESNSSPKSVLCTGHKSDGSTVTHTFVTDGVLDGPGGVDDFETFSFPATFDDIVRLSVEGSVFALDNLILDDPESIRLDIEGTPPVPAGNQVEITHYSEDDFTMRPLVGGSLSRSRSGAASSPDNGGTYLHFLEGDTFEMGNDNGILFDVLIVDLSEYSTAFQVPKSITWKGYKPDGTTVTHTFVTDGSIDGAGGAPDFETFTFPAEFSGLTKLETLSGPMAVDNLVVRLSDEPIPTGTLRIESTGSTDTVATLYNSAHEVVVSNDDSGSGSNFLINQDDFPVGTYFLRVSEFGNNSTGTYAVEIGYSLELPPPPAPSHFTATRDNVNSVILGWDEPVTASTYTLYRNATDDFGGASVLASGLSGASYSDTSAAAGQLYYYWITGANSGGEGPPAGSVIGEKLVPGPEITSQPIDEAVSTGHNAALSVAATTGMGSLNYQWYQGREGDTSVPVGTNSPEYTVLDVTETRYFWVRVSNGFNHTDSEVVSVSVVLDAPVLVTASREWSATTILVRWMPVPGALSYGIFRHTSDDPSGAVKVGASASASFEDVTAAYGQDYFYFVRAINDVGTEGVVSGGDAHRGSLRATSLDGSLIPGEEISNLRYSPDGAFLYIAGGSGWLDRYRVADRSIDGWAAVGTPVLGLDADESGTRVLAAAGSSNGGTGTVYEIDFGVSPAILLPHAVGLGGGETSLFDVQFVGGDLGFITSLTTSPTAPLRQVNLSSGTISVRSGVLTGNGEVGTGAFFAPASAAHANWGEAGTGGDPGLHRLTVVQPEPAAAGWFSYDVGDDSFGEEEVHPAVARFAATSPHGDFVAIADGVEAAIFDPEGNPVTTIPHSGGLAFSPSAHQLYLADASTDAVRVFSTHTWLEVVSLPIPGGLDSNPGPFGQGEMEVRPDGKELALVCAEGIRFLDLSPVVSATPEVVPGAPPALIGRIGEANAGISTSFSLVNPDPSAPMNWFVDFDAEWLDLSATSGTIPAGESLEIVAALNGEADSLPENSTFATLKFVDPGTGRYVSVSQEVRLLTTARLPVFEDFEDVLDDHWSITGTGPSRAIRTTEHEPLSGGHHFVMDSRQLNQFARNDLTLTVDLRDATGVELHFRAREFVDERHVPPPSPFSDADFDGVSISEDGVNWYAVLTFPGTFAGDQEFSIDLDAETAARGLSYGPSFKIRFTQYDNAPVAQAGNSDGIAIDNIEVTSAADRLVPGAIRVENLSGVELSSGANLDFGLLPEGGEAFFTLKVRNAGGGVLAGIDASIIGANEFGIVERPATRLIPGADTNMRIRFRPFSVGDRAGTVGIESNDGANSPHQLELTGSAYYTVAGWRRHYFGTTSNSGDAADDADPNHDGITNREAFAFGLHPLEFSIFPVIITAVTDTTITARYTRSASARLLGIGFVVEWRDDLSGGAWDASGVSETVVDVSDGRETVELSIPSGGRDSRFIRVRIE